MYSVFISTLLFCVSVHHVNSIWSHPVFPPCSLYCIMGGLGLILGNICFVSNILSCTLSLPVLYSCPVLCSQYCIMGGLGSDTGTSDLGNISFVSNILSCHLYFILSQPVMYSCPVPCTVLWGGLGLIPSSHLISRHSLFIPSPTHISFIQSHTNTQI